MAALVCNDVDMMMQHTVLHEAEGDGKVKEVRMATYGVGSFVHRSKASSANLLQSSVATDSHLLVFWISSPSGCRGRWLFGRHDERSEAGVVLH